MYLAGQCMQSITNAHIELSEAVLCALFRLSTCALAEMSFAGGLSRQMHFIK